MDSGTLGVGVQCWGEREREREREINRKLCSADTVTFDLKQNQIDSKVILVSKLLLPTSLLNSYTIRQCSTQACMLVHNYGVLDSDYVILQHFLHTHS